MHVYLVRHTKPKIANGICYGQADIELASTFENERDVLVDKLNRGIDPDALFSSPLRRCKRLAQGLAESLGELEVKIDERLLEMSFGEWELMPWDHINREALDSWSEDFVTRSPPGGESLRELYRRTVGFAEFLRNQPYRSVQVVAHAGFIRCFWAYIGKLPLGNIFEVEVEFGDVFEARLTTKPGAGSITRI